MCEHIQSAVTVVINVTQNGQHHHLAIIASVGLECHQHGQVVFQDGFIENLIGDKVDVEVGVGSQDDLKRADYDMCRQDYVTCGQRESSILEKEELVER